MQNQIPKHLFETHWMLELMLSHFEEVTEQFENNNSQ
jgi:hypothetical protein